MSDNAAIVQESVNSAIKRLTRKGTGKRTGKFTAWGTAMLAKLRRAAGTLPGERADVWEVTVGALSDEITGNDREKAEFAIHTALTLFGLHQQSSYESVSKEGVRFGKAVKSLIAPDLSNEAGVYRRFNALATASEFTELSHHLRGLVQMMRAQSSGFDYPRFAKELYWYQLNPELYNKVRMSWARDFYTSIKDKSDQKEAEKGKHSDE
jgi:CRISPR system Cascade subunit CasB